MVKKFEPYTREQLVRDIIRRGNELLDEYNVSDPEHLTAHAIRELSAEIRGYTQRALAATRLDIREKNQELQAETIEAERKVKKIVAHVKELKKTLVQKEREVFRARAKIVDLTSKNGAQFKTDPFFDSRETADFLGLSPALFARMRKRGEGPRFHKIGPRIIRYRLSSIEKYIDSIESEEAEK